MHHRLRVLLVLGALLSALSPPGAWAVPLQLTEAEFDLLAAAESTLLIEDFESFSPSTYPTPLVLTNGVYTIPSNSNQAIVAEAGNAACIAGEGNCLAAFDPQSTRNFAVPSLAFWGADLKLVELDDVFDITVVGGSGTLSLDAVGLGGSSTPFVGFRDDLGIFSVQFTNVSLAPQGSAGNYSFDNVTTPVPEPSTVLLLASGLGLLGLLRRQPD